MSRPCANRWPAWMLLLLAGGFLAALWWARERDPFVRMEFTLRGTGIPTTPGLAVLPKPGGRFPVAVLFHGAGGNLIGNGRALRQLAELGLAAVAIEYDQTNQLKFNGQAAALSAFLRGQSWAQTNATAWIGRSLGAQRTLALLAQHPETQPQVYVRLAGGWPEEMETAKARTEFKGRVLLLHPERDEVFPVADCARVADWFAKAGARVEQQFLPGLPHNFGDEFAVVVRAAAEFCRGNLPLADYTAALKDCPLTRAERLRFNMAMSRAGANRRVLWRIVNSLAEPERRTAMMMIGGLEDYDLAHLTAAHGKEIIQQAWAARRKYPWCRDTPLEVFERFVASPRTFEEPLGRHQADFARRLDRVVKYCKTTGEACDALGDWRALRAVYGIASAADEPTPEEVFANGGGTCKHVVLLYTALARSVGIPLRPVMTTWPTLGSGHYWVEVWDAQERGWHAFDGSASDRPYHFDWFLNVAKAATYATTGERGAWYADREKRWEVFTNTVGLFYPGGRVLVRVHDHGSPKTGERVNVETWLKGEMVRLATGITDGKGEIWFTLGQSARRPYRFVLAGGADRDWQWLAVKAGGNYEVVLDSDSVKEFSAAETPPSLGFPEWERPKKARK